MCVRLVAIQKPGSVSSISANHYWTMKYWTKNNDSETFGIVTYAIPAKVCKRDRNRTFTSHFIAHSALIGHVLELSHFSA